MQAAFVSIGLDRDAFLYVEDVAGRPSEFDFGEDGAEPDGPGRRGRRRASRPRIDDLVKEGQEIVVQVTKDAVGGKGPRVTAGISLAGPHARLPARGAREIGVSRRI